MQLDLANGYLVLPLTEDAQEKTAFVTPDDTEQFTRMPFGLAGAPGEFTRLMHKVLVKQRNTVVEIYRDDWVINATNWTEILGRLREVLMRLRFANLTLKPAKCSLGANYIEFLVIVIGGGTICPGNAKTRAVQEFPKPKDFHEIRRLLGLTGFFRRFVENYATVALPLTILTKTGITFVWREPQQETFEKLKNVLVSKPAMIMFNQNFHQRYTQTPALQNMNNAVTTRQGRISTKVDVLYQQKDTIELIEILKKS